MRARGERPRYSLIPVSTSRLPGGVRGQCTPQGGRIRSPARRGLAVSWGRDTKGISNRWGTSNRRQERRGPGCYRSQIRRQVGLARRTSRSMVSPHANKSRVAALARPWQSAPMQRSAAISRSEPGHVDASRCGRIHSRSALTNGHGHIEQCLVEFRHQCIDMQEPSAGQTEVGTCKD